MLSLSKKLFHAMEAVIYIGCHQAEAPVSSKDIAEIQDLPPRYLEQILQKLVRAEILRGVRGPHGGYLLAREKRRITMRDIYLVIEEESLLDSINSHGSISDTLYGVWQELHSGMLEILGNTTLAELCAKVAKSKTKLKKTADFTI